MEIGERIISLREKKGWKQKDLADKVNLNVSVMNRVEKGTRPLTDSEIIRVADALEVSTDILLGRPIQQLPNLTAKDEKDIAKKLENILNSMESGTALSFDGEPMDEETMDLVRAAIESNLILTKQLAKKKFTPNKYRKE